jgi:hypothetical protein
MLTLGCSASSLAIKFIIEVMMQMQNDYIHFLYFQDLFTNYVTMPQTANWVK